MDILSIENKVLIMSTRFMSQRDIHKRSISCLSSQYFQDRCVKDFFMHMEVVSVSNP